MQRLKAIDSYDVELMIQRLRQFEEHEEEINKIKNIPNQVQINEEINSLIVVVKNQKFNFLYYLILVYAVACVSTSQ